MKKIQNHLNFLFLILLTFLLAACGGNSDTDELPTLVEISDVVSPTVAGVPNTDGRSTLPATWTVTPVPTETPTSSITTTITVTPSNTITDTPSPTYTSTPSETSEPSSLIFLAQTAAVSTPLPTQFQSALIPSPDPLTQTPFIMIPTPTVGTVCQFSPPGGFGTIYAADPALASQLGCAIGAPPVTQSLIGASQTFQTGSMIYLSGTPGAIYVLYASGTFQRYDDTYLAGVDPDSGGQTPPQEGLIEPIRGFGKVWRTNMQVQTSLGWATTAETGGNVTALEFSQGRMIYLDIRGDIVVLIYPQAGVTTSGIWRAVPGQF